MKKDIKGFTLVELLAVITVLGIVMAIGAISVNNLINRSKEKSYNEQVNAIELAAKTFATKHTEILDEELEENYILIDELKKDGLLENENMIDPRDGKEIEGCINVVYNKETNKYEYNFTEVCKYIEKILNGADPELSSELVPVIIKDNGEVYKADITEKWYSYEEKTWANAVILFGEDNYADGDRIYESKIKEYYVWIPKYSYRLWNVNGDNTTAVEKPIEIVFGSKAKTTGTNNGDMYLHPAFTNFNTQGIWVGKFETSYNEKTYTDSTTFFKQNANHELATDHKNIIIKPNTRSLTSKYASDLYLLLAKNHKNLNSHMMMNMEWGATAYLTYSIYGRCDNNSCTEVMLNNVNIGYDVGTKLYEDQYQWGPTVTGCAANNFNDPTNSISSITGLNTYNTEKGVLASTTGNISGIYDMSGGSSEYMMSLLVSSDGNVFSGQTDILNSGFKGIYGCPTCDHNINGGTANTTGAEIPSAKYYDKYEYKYNYKSSPGNYIWYDYSNGKLGDATKEVATSKSNVYEESIGDWFGDIAEFPTPVRPWMIRGGLWSFESGAGIFCFHTRYGYMDPVSTARSVLAF